MTRCVPSCVVDNGISSGNNSGGGTTGAKTELVGGDGGISSGMGSCVMSSATGVGSMSRSCSTPIFQSSAVRSRLCGEAKAVDDTIHGDGTLVGSTG